MSEKYQLKITAETSEIRRYIGLQRFLLLKIQV